MNSVPVIRPPIRTRLLNTKQAYYYRFRFTSSSSIVSLVVMTLLFA